MFWRSIWRLKCYLLLMLPFETFIVLYFQKNFGFGKLEVGNKKSYLNWKVRTIFWDKFLQIVVFKSILPQKKAKMVKFMKVSLAKVSLIKVYLFWASHSKYLLLFIVIIIIVIANIVIKEWPFQHIINTKLVLIWCMIRLPS